MALQAHAQHSTQNEENVSTLNNQIVKVGERNEYLYDYFKYNVSVDPLGLIVGSYEVAGSYAFHPNLAVRLSVGYVYEPYGVKIKGFSTTLSLPVYFKKVYSGIFLEPGISFATVRETNGDQKATAIGPEMLVGWHWMWDSGLNFAAAFGVQRNFTGKESDDGALANYSKFRATGYLTAGWAF